MASDKIYGSENRRQLFDSLSKDGFDLGTFEDFNRNMDDENVRKSIHEAAIGAGWDLPDYDQFDSDMAVRRLKIGGQSQEVDHATYDDFIKRHPSGSNRKPANPQPKPQQAPVAAKPAPVSSAPSPVANVAETEAPEDPVMGTPWGTEGSATGKSNAYKPFAPGQVRETGDPGTPDYGIPYRPYTQMSAAARHEIERENDFTVRQLKKMQQEKQRRRQPLVDTGSPEANKNIIKTQGQWDDELQQGVKRISNSVVVPAVDKAIAEFDKKAHEVFESTQEGGNAKGGLPTGTASGATIFGSMRESNQAKDPEKILEYLNKQMEGIYKNEAFLKQVSEEANRMGIDGAEYIENIIKPQIAADIQSRFDQTMIARELPKSGKEYVVSGLSNSIVGTLADAFLETKSQRYYKNQAEAMTEEGGNPYYNPSTPASLAKMGVSFAADAPFFGVYGRVSGQVAKQVAEREIKSLVAKGMSETAARNVVGTALENSVGARMKNYLMQHVIGGSLTMGAYNATSEAARQARDKEGVDLARLAGSTAEGLAVGAAFGATGAATQALSQPLSGFSKLGAKAAGFGAEAETMYTTEELTKMLHGEDAFENPFEGSLEALEKLGVMKLSGGHLLESAGKKLVRAKEVGGKQVAQETLAQMLGQNRTGIKFTDEEQAYVRNSQEGQKLIDGLSQMHPGKAITEVNGKKKLTKEGEALRVQLSQNYEDFMNNKDIPANVKQKVAGVLGGIYRPGLETGADIIQNEDGSVLVKTRDKDGNCIQDLSFDNLAEADKWRDSHLSECRRNDAVNMWNSTSDQTRQEIVNIVRDNVSGKAILDEMKSKAGGMKQNRLKRQLEKINQIAEQYEGRELTDEEARNFIQMVIRDGDEATFGEIYQLIHDMAYPKDMPDVKRNYWEGQQLSTMEKHFAHADAQLAEERLMLQGEDFAKEVMDDAQYPDEKISELAARLSRGYITKDQFDAAVNYYNKMSKVNGMFDETLKDIDNQVEAANSYVRKNTHADSGSLIDAVYAKKPDRQYYVTAGHFEVTPDGKLMPTDNSGMVILRDKETGEIEVVSPSEITVSHIDDPNRVIAENESMEGLRGQLMKEADDVIDLHPDTPTEAMNGDIYTGADGNQYMVMQIQDEAGNPVGVKIAIDETGNPVGNPMPFDMEEYRKAKSNEIDAAERPQEETVLPEDNQVTTEPQPLEEPAAEAAVGAPEQETKPAGGEASVEKGTGVNEPSAAVSPKVPVDEKGKKLYEQATPEDALADLTAEFGEEDAQQMITQMVENTDKALKALQEQDTSDMTDMNDIRSHMEKIKELQKKRDFWQGLVKNSTEADEQKIEAGQSVDIQHPSGESGGNGEAGKDEIQTQGTEEKIGPDTQQPRAEGSEADTGSAPVPDTNVSGGAPATDVKGRKQVKRGLEKLTENYEKGDLIGCLNEINTIMKNVKAGEKGAITPEEKAYINRILKEAKKAGYEVIDLEGKEYNEGSKQTADFQNDPTLPLGTRVISNVRKPLIVKNGKIAQAADVVVKQNLGQNDIEKLQVKKIDLQKDLESLKRANQNDVVKAKISELESEIAKIDEDIKQLEKQSAEQKVAQAIVKNNIGKRYEFKNQDGTRSEFVIDNFKGDDMVTVTRQDYDQNGNPKSEPYSQDLKYVDVGNSIVNGYLKPSLSTDEELRQNYKYHNRKSGDIPIIDVLTDNEKAQILEALRSGDIEKVGYLEGEFINQHREDFILRGRELRNQKVEKAMSRGSRAERLRAAREQYKGYDSALSMLEDAAMEPQSIEEYVADALGDVPKPGKGFLAYESYDQGDNKIVGLKDESGFGKRGFAGDTKGFNPWLAPKGKGISLKQFAERIHESLPEGMKEQFSDQDIRNVIQTVMTGAEKPTDIANYILNSRIEQAEAEARHYEDRLIDEPSFQKLIEESSFANRLKRGKESVNTEPTDGQKEAGNYKKGHISFGGYDFTIENPEGTMRRGTDKTGRKWEQKMNNTYGYILGKYGKDGDHLDMFINDAQDLDNWNGNVYVVDQIDPKTGKLDEHKILYGFDSLEEAKKAYLSNYEEGWKGLGKITGVTKDTFDKWLDSSKRKYKEFADHSIIKDHMVESEHQGFDSAMKQLNTRGISINDPELMKQYGLKDLTLSKTGDHVTLNKIVVEDKGQGNGTRFMEDLARLADEKGWTLALTPSGGFGAKSVKRLKDFYKRFGFADNKGRNADFYTRESMIRRPKETVGANTPERQEQALRDAVVEHLRSKGIEVSTDWKLGQKILDEYNGNGQVKKMGSRVESKKKQLSEELGDREMTDAQKTIANVFTGKSDNEVITISRDGKDFAVKMRQGNELGAGTKHSLYGHYNTGLGVISADDIMRIPNVLANGERKPKQHGNVKLAEYRLKDENGVRYTVVTEVKNSGEVFNDFYTNKKASNQTPQMPEGDTPESARTNDLNASGAKVQQNSGSSKDSGRKFFKTADGHAYGYTMGGKIYVDPRIATSKTPIHEYGHLYCAMKRQTDPEGWNDWKQVMFGDKLVQPIIDKVRRDYPELSKDGKEDDFAEEIITQFSGKRGSERLREIADEVAKEKGGVFGKAEAITAMQRLKSILNRFWEGIAKMMGWKYTNANQIADLIMADMLNGVDPTKMAKDAGRLRPQAEIERTLMGVHNLSEDKLRKVLKQGGLANPSLAVIDTNNHMHTDYGDISLIPKSSLIDARTGRNAGTFTADAWTPTYPTVKKRMSSKGQSKFWKDIRSLNEDAGEVASHMRMAFDTWLDHETGQERLAYWYMKEKGMNPELVLNKNPYGEDIVKRIDELTDDGNLEVSRLPEEQIKEIADMYHAYKESKGEPVTPAEERIAKLQERIDPNKQSPFTKLQQFRLDELKKYGELLHNLNDFVYAVGRSAFSDGKPNVDATIDKATKALKEQNLEQDFDKWLQDKADSYGIEEWLYSGTDDRTGEQKWVRNTLQNASKLMKKQGLNGAVGWSSLGNWIATVANKEKTLGGIRKYRKNLATTKEQHDTWKENWGNRLYPIVEKLGGGDVFHDDNVMADILEHGDYAGYYKREYGKELSKEDRATIDEFIRDVRTNFPTGYFKTKFERPVMLDEFEIAVVPENTSPDIVEALKNAGLDVRTYDNTGAEDQKDANRKQAAMEAVQGRDDIMFQMVGKEGAAEADRAEGNDERSRNLTLAEDSEKAGVDPKAIKLATGWERGADGQWRYEIPDADADILSKYKDKVDEMKADGVESPEPILKLGELLGENNELFRYYPNIKDMPVLFSRGLPVGTAGAYDKGAIELNIKELNRFEGDDLNNENVYGTLLHEVQHAIQGIEGFAQGGNLNTSTTDEGINAIIEKKNRQKAMLKQQLDANRKILNNPEELKAAAELENKSEKEVKDNLLETINTQAAEYDTIDLQIARLKNTKSPSRTDAMDLYRRLAGEVEARNVESRMALNDIGKRQTLASVTEDVPRDEQVIIMGDGTAMNINDIKPVGKGGFGDIYDQFKGKPKEAVDFLIKKKGGDLLGVFHRDEVGDIDLVWGESHNPYKGKGLSHIIKKHIDTLHDFKDIDDLSDKLDDVVNNGNVGYNGNNIEITKDGYRVVLAQENDGKKWILTAFDNSKTKKEKLSSVNTPGTPIDNLGSRAVAADDASLSEGKDTKNINTLQENTEKSSEEAPKFQLASNPESEMTPEERQYWNQWDAAMKKWKERNAIPADQTQAPEKPKYQQGESALDYAQKLVQWNRMKSLWQTAPKLEDYRQVRDDRDIVEAVRQNEQRYPDSPSAKMRRVASDMMRIRHAMSRQKAYDKATVKAVTDFAQDFMKLGFGDNLSRGEMERMLSSVKNATGAKDIKKNVDNIMNILIDNHLRNLDQRVQKLSSTKELSKTAQGVEKQGRLELKGQRMIQAFRQAREQRMTPEQIRERMSEVAEKMNRSDDEAPMWEQEYEGLGIALQYAENIEGSRSEWADLNNLYKDAVNEYKNSGRSYKDQQEYLESLEQAMQENKIERIGLFGDIIGRLEGNISESMQGAKEFVEREKERVKKIQQMANFDLAGKDMGAMRDKVKGKPANFFLQPLGTFEQMLKQFGSRNANGEGYLYDYFMRNWMETTDKAFLNEQKAKEELDAKAREIFGNKVKRWSDLYEIERDLPMMEVEVLDGEEPKTFKLTQGNLLYIYMADKMTDGRMKLRKMGIDEEAVNQIKDFLDPRLKDLGDWLQSEYLPSKRTEYNKVHERMFGAPMAAIDNYFPLKVLGDARYQEQDVNVPDSETLPSTITGNIIKRRKNALPLDILHTDALSLAVEHIEDMERWAAKAEWNKDINTLLSYTTFRNKVKNMNTIYGSGDALWNAFKDAAKMAAGTYSPKAKPGSVDAAISNIAKGVTAAKINFRVYTAFKQLLSAPAFLHDVNLADFAHDAVNPYGSWKWAMENMPVFQKRWKSRQVGDTRLMDDPTDWKLWKTNIVQMATRLGMSPNALVDGVTCAVGARSIYKSRYKKYKEIGASDEVAHKRALQDAEIGYNLTQQSSEGAFVSAIQKDRTVAANMLSVFRNSSMAYTRQWYDAYRNLKKRSQKGYKEDSIKFMARQMQEQFGLDEAQAKRAAELEYAREGRRDVARLLNMMFGVTVAWNLGASLPYLLIGDDDNTKKEMLTDALMKGLLAGPTEGLAAGNLYSDFIGRTLANEQTRNTFKEEGIGAALDNALKQGGDYEVNPLPLMADLQGMIKKMGYDKYAAAQDVFNIAMQSAVGVNPQTFTDMWNAIMDYTAPGWDGTSYTWKPENMANSKELALFMMRLMNAPTSSWRNKYIDELGMNAEDAQKLPYEEMARRYAHYKHWKDAPIMGWLRGEEARNEKIDKMQKQFDKAVEERMARLTDEELMHNVARSESAEEKRKYAKMIAQRLGLEPGEDSQKADEKKNWYQNLYQQKMLYEDIKEDEMLADKYKNLENTFKEKREEAERKSVQDLKEFNEANKEWKDRIAEAKKEAKKRMDWIRGGKYDTPSGKKGNSKKANLLAPGKKQLETSDDTEAIMKNIRQWRKEALEILMRAEKQ